MNALVLSGAALLLSGHAEVWSLVLLGLLFGSADAYFFPAFSALIPQVVPEDRLQEANALRGISESVGWFIGPAISGVLIAVIGAGGTIAIDAATFLVSAAFLSTLRVPPLVRTLSRQSFVAELRHGWREVRSRTWLWVMMLRAMLVLFVTIVAVVLIGTTAATPLVALALGSGLFVQCVVWVVRGVAIGLLIAGPAAEALGVTTACWLSAILGLLFSLWLLAVRDVWRRAPSHPHAQPSLTKP